MSEATPCGPTEADISWPGFEPYSPIPHSARLKAVVLYSTFASFISVVTLELVIRIILLKK
uniref:Uncharacterized protein n=1 Tax=Anguilla anguilla TaxID=7936 RepID=A0A0E9W6E7_ANGAN